MRRAVTFADRADAGRRLAARLMTGPPTARTGGVVVLGLPRGGVPVAYEVATALQAPLDVILVRKLGVPYQPELGMGAVGEDGARVVNDEIVRLAQVRDSELAAVEARERAELQRRARRYRGERPRVDLAGRTAIVVDDGIATGSTAKAACEVARAHGAAHVVLAAPVAPAAAVAELRAYADEVVVLDTPEPFYAIGEFYRDFTQTSDETVVNLLDRSRDDWVRRDREVVIPAGGHRLAGHLTVPRPVAGLVVFAHGSGSSRHSPRNRLVAGALNEAGMGTLLFDLLTANEELDRANVFDVALLGERLAAATAWLQSDPEAGGLPLGYFGASTGAAAALWAAAEPQARIAGIVSRGGRPDLAGERLGAVRAPTLLIVGGHDDVVIELNQQARARLRCPSRLEIVPGATHLFSEPGALEAVCHLARDWFMTCFRRN